MTEPKEVRCVDCNKRLEMLWELDYRVLDRVWLSVGYAPGDKSCIRCLEDRLKRTLRRDEFSDDPINLTRVNKSPRLLQRLGYLGRHERID